MKKILRKNLLSISGMLLGALLGYIYWSEIGCLSGSCAITSSPVNSTLYGALMGFLLPGLFRKSEK